MRLPDAFTEASSNSFVSILGIRSARLMRYLAVGAAVGVGATGALAIGPASNYLSGTTSAVHSSIMDAVPGATTNGAAAGKPLPAQLPDLGQQSQEEEDLHDGTKLAPWQMKGGVKEFHLTAAPLAWQTKPGGSTLTGLAINGQIPAPTVRVNEGDRVRFVVKNEMPEDTSIHWHGMDLPNDQDGVPHLTQDPIAPDDTFTYEWTVISTGTHWYHSHMHGDQEGRGLYGSLEVVPKAGDIPSDRDYRIITGDGALGFVFNGKSFPGTRALRAKVGERVRIRLIGAGPDLIHSIHLHSGFFELVAQDGHPLPMPQKMDTINLGVGQTYDLIWTPTRPGKWMIHCHLFSHSETRHGMTGMVSIFNVDPATVKLPAVGG